jgi:hypothetical protein
MNEEEKLDIVEAVKDLTPQLSESVKAVQSKMKYLGAYQLQQLSTQIQIAAAMIDSNESRRALLSAEDGGIFVTMMVRAMQTYNAARAANPVNATFADVYQEALEGTDVGF